MRVMTPARTHVLACAGHRTISGVEIHLVVVFNIPQYTHTLEHVYVLAVVDNTRQIIQVSGGRFAVLVANRVGHHHSSPSGRKMYPGT